jgi:hypothetical protein
VHKPNATVIAGVSSISEDGSYPHSDEIEMARIVVILVDTIVRDIKPVANLVVK